MHLFVLQILHFEQKMIFPKLHNKATDDFVVVVVVASEEIDHSQFKKCL